MVIEKEFKRFSAKSYYGYVKIDVDMSSDFNFKSLVNWPTPMDGSKYEECICVGIKEALNECGYNIPFGSYTLEKIKVSENMEESVPIAYCWAAKQAMKEFLSHGT